jgi:chemotaxis protein methyltransferase CheR
MEQTLIDPASFARLKTLIYDLAGIDIKPGKEALVSGRLQKRMRELGIDSFKHYLDRIAADPEGDEVVLLLDAISTNVTSFFREAEHFALLKTETARWVAAGQTRFRVWCAASSSGEEPYTIAMTMMEAIGSRKVDLRILATDISTRVLEMAKRGTYAASAINNVPPDLRKKWFLPDGDGRLVRVKDELRALVTYNRLNLAKPPYPMKGPIDVVFCRNVMIYFDNQVRSRIIGEVRRLVRPGGLLCVGHAESLSTLQGDLLNVQAAAYRIPG